jgi:ribosomal protein L16/L10AE
MKDFEKEIQIVENMIRLLNQCLTIHLKKRQFKEVKRVLSDIRICKDEIKKIQKHQGEIKLQEGEEKKEFAACSVKPNDVF